MMCEFSREKIVFHTCVRNCNFQRENQKKCTRNGKQTTVENELKTVAHNGTGFDTWLILNNPPKGVKS